MKQESNTLSASDTCQCSSGSAKSYSTYCPVVVDRKIQMVGDEEWAVIDQIVSGVKVFHFASHGHPLQSSLLAIESHSLASVMDAREGRYCKGGWR